MAAVTPTKTSEEGRRAAEDAKHKKSKKRKKDLVEQKSSDVVIEKKSITKEGTSPDEITCFVSEQELKVTASSPSSPVDLGLELGNVICGVIEETDLNKTAPKMLNYHIADGKAEIAPTKTSKEVKKAAEGSKHKKSKRCKKDLAEQTKSDVLTERKSITKEEEDSCVENMDLVKAFSGSSPKDLNSKIGNVISSTKEEKSNVDKTTWTILNSDTANGQAKGVLTKTSKEGQRAAEDYKRKKSKKRKKDLVEQNNSDVVTGKKSMTKEEGTPSENACVVSEQELKEDFCVGNLDLVKEYSTSKPGDLVLELGHGSNGVKEETYIHKRTQTILNYHTANGQVELSPTKTSKEGQSVAEGTKHKKSKKCKKDLVEQSNYDDVTEKKPRTKMEVRASSAISLVDLEESGYGIIGVKEETGVDKTVQVILNYCSASGQAEDMPTKSSKEDQRAADDTKHKKAKKCKKDFAEQKNSNVVTKKCITEGTFTDESTFFVSEQEIKGQGSCIGNLDQINASSVSSPLDLGLELGNGISGVKEDISNGMAIMNYHTADDVESQENTSKAPLSGTFDVVTNVKAASKDGSIEEEKAVGQEASNMQGMNKAITAPEIDYSSEESSSFEDIAESSEEEQEVLSRPLKKHVTSAKVPNDVLTVVHKLVTSTEQTNGSNTLFVANLPFSVKRTDIEDFFKAAGEVVEVRLVMDSKGSCRGFGFVVFATAEATMKAFHDLNDKNLLGRPVRLEFEARRESKGSGEQELQSLRKSGNQGKTTIVRGFDTQYSEDQQKLETSTDQTNGSNTLVVGNLPLSVKRSDIEDFFKAAGEVVDVRLEMDSKGSCRRFGCVEFATAEATMKAFNDLNDKNLLGRPVKLEFEARRGSKGSGEQELQSLRICCSQGKTASFRGFDTLYNEDQRKLVTLTEQTNGSNTLFVANLPFSVKRTDVEDFFKAAGEVVEVRLVMDSKGSCRGFGFVVFATAEVTMKAFHDLNDKDLLGRPVRLEFEARRESKGSGEQELQSLRKIGSQGKTTIVRGFDTQYSEDQKLETSTEQTNGSNTLVVGNLPLSVKRSDIEDFFRSAGEVVDVRLVMDSKGSCRRFGCVEFATAEATMKAFNDLNDKDLLGLPVKLEFEARRGSKGSGEQELQSLRICGSQGKTTSFRGFDTHYSEDQQKLVTVTEQTNGSNTLFVANLPFSVKRTDVEDFFKTAGEVVEVRLVMDSKGSCRGFGFVVFATAEATMKAFHDLNDKDLLGRPVRLEFEARRESKGSVEQELQSLRKSGSQGKTTIVRGFDKHYSEDQQKLVTSTEQTNGSNTLFVGNLPFSVKRSDIEDFFKAAGEVVDVRLVMDLKGSCRGFGFVVFATAEATMKAFHDLNDKDLLGRPVKLEFEARRESKGNGEQELQSLRKSGSQGKTTIDRGFDTHYSEEQQKLVTSTEQTNGSNTLFVGNLPFSVKRTDVEDFFKAAGEVVDVRLVMDSKGSCRRFGFVEFANAEATMKAFNELNDKNLLGLPVKLEFEARKGSKGSVKKNCNHS